MVTWRDIPARPYRGTSFSSLTTMFRSASLAFFDMLRVCCGPQASKFCRVNLRMHDVHCGSRDDLLMDAIVDVAELQRHAAKKRGTSFNGSTANMEIVANPCAAAEAATGRCACRRWHSAYPAPATLHT
jgi:hypothetical protein